MASVESSVLRRATGLLITIVAVAVSSALCAQTASIDPLKGGMLGNEQISAKWQLTDGHLSGLFVRDKKAGKSLTLNGPFSIALRDGRVLHASDFVVNGAARVEHFTPDPAAARYSERLAGIAVHYALGDPEGRFTADWAVILREGSQYIRQSLTIHAGAQVVDVSDLSLVDLHSRRCIGWRCEGLAPGRWGFLPWL